MLAAQQVYAAAEAAGNDIDQCLELAARFGAGLPQPGKGDTAQRWTLLAAAAAADLTPARVLEAHSDALAILHEAGASPPEGTWGVFAAEAPGVRVEERDGRLYGTKPWCSLGDRLDRALVTAFVGDPAENRRALFAVDLRRADVRADPPGTWVARGLAAVTSAALHFDGTPAEPVGESEWYLRRPGFAWGGMGVAACWYGGAHGLVERLRDRAATRGGELDLLHLGAADVCLHAAGAVLRQAAAAIDAGQAFGSRGELLALRVRSAVAGAVEEVLRRAAHALGPAPLAFDERHARRVADLEIYLRQHHGERDLAAAGRSALAEPGPVERLRSGEL